MSIEIVKILSILVSVFIAKTLKQLYRVFERNATVSGVPLNNRTNASDS